MSDSGLCRWASPTPGSGTRAVSGTLLWGSRRASTTPTHPRPLLSITGPPSSLAPMMTLSVFGTSHPRRKATSTQMYVHFLYSLSPQDLELVVSISIPRFEYRFWKLPGSRRSNFRHFLGKTIKFSRQKYFHLYFAKITLKISRYI
jgi:hypothetical protein